MPKNFFSRDGRSYYSINSASFSETISRKLTEVLKKNDGFAVIMENRVQSWTPAETQLVAEKYLVSSADLERSFST